MATHLVKSDFVILQALTGQFFLSFPIDFCLIEPMSNKSGSGRWDHLLREIPNQQSFEINAPAKVEKPQVPDPIVPPKQELVLETQESEETVYQVSELNRAIKRQLEGEFTDLWVQGEISNFKAHSSGHHYFSLKDDRSQVSAVMFKGFNAKLKFTPESGMEVLVRGKISVYEPRGSYQVFCEHMEPVGAGALQKAFEQLKAKLDKEGLFAQPIKKPIPSHPKRVGVVTSPTGAAIQDILNVLRRRSKRVEVVVIPARVQGQTAAAEVVKGIELANKIGGFDVLIVGRGGGSIEDLWCFNEEIVARSIFASKIPIISAVGHEIDFTISDFVADLRAPTPSAAAEVVARSEDELREKIRFYSKSLRLIIFQKLTQARNQINGLEKSLVDPRKYLQDSFLRLDDWTLRLQQVVVRLIENKKMKVRMGEKGLKNPLLIVKQRKEKNQNLNKLLLLAFDRQLSGLRNRLSSRMGLLDSLSPLRVLDRGYGIVRSNGSLVSKVENFKDTSIQVELKDGFIEAEVKKVTTKEKA